MEKNWKDIPGLVFSKKFTLITVDFLVSVLQKDFQVIIMLFSISFGHDFIDSDGLKLLFGVIENGAGLGVDHGYISQLVFR